MTGKKNEDEQINEENVSVPKSEWDKVMSRLSALESQKNDDEEIIGADTDEERKLTCRVRTYEGRPITRIFDMVQIGIDEISKNGLMRCTVVTVEKDGKEKTHKGVDWNVLRNSVSDTCDLLEVRKKKMTQKGDLVDEKYFDEKSNRMVTTGRKVRLAVNYTVNKHIVSWNGEIVELDEVNL